MGAVYKVRHRLLGEDRVVKVMHPHLENDASLRDRFLNEARAAVRIAHPNLARIFDFTIDEHGVAYLVMEYIHGATLGQLIRAKERPPLALALEIAEQSLTAIGQVHKHGIVHRDIAPDNLMLTRDIDNEPVVKLIDLGLAKSISQGASLTASGMFLGKFRYAAPEIFDEGIGQGLDTRGDLYAFALVLYELLTGVYPISGTTSTALIAGHLFRPPMPFSESDPTGRIPETIRHAVLRGLAKKPDERFATADDFIASLHFEPAELDSEERLESPTTARILTLIDSAELASEAYGAGSTQAKLDAQFGPTATPIPGPPSSLGNTAAPSGPTGPAAMDDLTTLVAEARTLAAQEPIDDVREARTLRIPEELPPITAPSEDIHELPTLQVDSQALRAAAQHPAAGTTPPAGAEATQRIEDIPPPPPAAPPPPVAPPVVETERMLDTAISDIRSLAESGDPGRAHELLQRTIRAHGEHPTLLELRSELGMALLQNDANQYRPEESYDAPEPEERGLDELTLGGDAGQGAAQSLDAMFRGGGSAESSTTLEAPTSPLPPGPSPTEGFGMARRSSFPGGSQGMAAAALAVLALLAAVVFVWHRMGPAVDSNPDLEPVDVTASQLSPGHLVLEASPWGELTAVVDSEDQEIPVAARHTPLRLSIPPGRYRLTVRHPPSDQEQVLDIEIQSDGRLEQRVSFETIDAEAYFDAMGW